MFGQLFDLLVQVHYVRRRRLDKDAVTEDER